ncbi:MAG: PA14 domain-containing protein [Rhodothermales bacterium]
MFYRWILLVSIFLISLSPNSAFSTPAADEAPTVQEVLLTGELKRWHTITLEIQGPDVSESDVINPFFDYRLEATFSLNGDSYTVPGYYAADGNAAETSASSGTTWRVHFTPQDAGAWQYTLSFVKGTDVAIDENAAVDQIILDNVTGSFSISNSDKTGQDLKGKGALQHVGEAYLQFANGEWYIKGGTDSPENILAYTEFDGTYSLDEINFVKDFDPHIQDWTSGNPTWQSNKGKGLIGAVNYLSSQSVNAAFILINNLGLNDSEDEGNEDVWPWTSPDVLDRYDVSKLAQWDIVFQHMQEKGIVLHFALQEIDNDVLLDNGDLGRDRKLFYREMFARFGYHNGVIWNIGEELRSDRNTDAQRKSYIDYIAGLDPYGHAIVAHTWPGEDEYEAIYGPLLGYPTFDGIAFQIHLGSEATGDLKVYENTKNWYNQAVASGRKWAIMMDECCGWKTGVRPWSDEYNLDEVRADVLWGNLMAGGAGVEWFFGDRKPVQYDLSTEDFRLYSLMWAYTRHARNFFFDYIPFVEMTPQTGLTEDEEHLVFAKPGEVYAIYLREGGSPELDLEAYVGNYRVKWYNPRHGGGLQHGSVLTVSGAGSKQLGSAPYAEDDDWVVLVENIGFSNYTIANYTHAQAPENPLKINFDASIAESNGGTIVSYDWDFGDGTTGSGQSPAHSYLKAGTYQPILTVTDNQGNSDSFSQQLAVIPVPGDVQHGLWGEYFNNTSFSGTAETRLDSRINFKWGNGIPIRLVDDDNFTVRWNGHLLADHTEAYEFRLEIEDGGRLWIDNQLLIDTWDTGGYSNTSVTVSLQAGKYHAIKLELIEETGRSDVRLFWSAPSVVEQIIPETHFFYAPDIMLPVELTSFSGIVDGKDLVLTWETASETNNAGFEIQLRQVSPTSSGESPQESWKAVHFERGNGTSEEAQAYTYRLEHLAQGAYQFRLKQVDFDGSFTFSDVIEISTMPSNEVVLHTNYPNPFNPRTVIRFDLPIAGSVRLTIYDATGRKISALVNKEMTSGRHEVTFDGTSLASGMYFYRLETAQTNLVRSMTLSK